jgi:16S rRNA processing protein RimM
MDLIVARIARPCGLQGEVVLDVRTDAPNRRLAPGAVLTTDPPEAGPLTVTRLRRFRGQYWAVFAQAPGREQAEALRGVALLAPAVEGGEPDAWYPHELAGLAAVLPDGTPAGTVVGVEPLPAGDALRVREPSGEVVLVPLVRALVPEVDPAAGRVVLDPPGGLLAVRPAT